MKLARMAKYIEEKGYRFKDKCPAMAFNSLCICQLLALSFLLSMANCLTNAVFIWQTFIVQEKGGERESGGVKDVGFLEDVNTN